MARGKKGEAGREWNSPRGHGEGEYGHDPGTGGIRQQYGPDVGRQFGSGDEGRGSAWGTGGHGSGSFGQSAPDPGANYGQGLYSQGQDYGGQFGQSGRGGTPGQQGYAQQEGYRGYGYESGRQMGYVGRGPRGYRRSDDRIREDVSEELTRHPGIDASDVEVHVENGEVTLTGTVESRQAKRMAEDCVDQCSGVKDVHNQLRVNRPGSAQGGPERPEGAGKSEGRKQGGEESRSRSSPARGRS